MNEVRQQKQVKATKKSTIAGVASDNKENKIWRNERKGTR